MILHPSLFVPGLLLLLFPADRLLCAKVELRDFESFHTLGRKERFRPWWWVAALWIDPIRSFIGARLLTASLDLRFGRWDVPPTAEYSVAIAIVVVAVLAQLVTRREAGVILAPLGFVSGIVASVSPWYATVIAITLAAAAMAGLRHFFAFFLGGILAIAILALVVHADWRWIILPLVALGVPALVGLVSGRAMELPTRNGSGPNTPPKKE